MNGEFAGKIRKVILLAALSFVLSSSLYLPEFLSLFEFKAFDLFSKYLNPDTPPEDIVLIQIDQQTIDALSSQSSLNWPWPRQVYAPLIEYLAEADAVFLDLLFTEPSSYGMRDDALMAEALRKASNVYLPVFLTENQKEMKPEDIEFLKSISPGRGPAHAVRFPFAIAPVSPQKEAAAGAGNVSIPPDRDGVYRKVPLVFQAGEIVVPHFVLSSLFSNGLVASRDGNLYVRDNPIPLLDGKWMYLRYYPRDNAFTTYSALHVFDAYNQSASGGRPKLQREYFRGKKVFIGLTAPGLYDLRPTPVSSISTGIQIHATTYDTITKGNFIQPVGKTPVMVFMACIILGITFTVLRYYSVTVNLLVFLLLLAVALAVPAILFRNGYYLHIIPPALSLIISFIISAAYSYATEGKERRFVRRTFAQYMDETIVAHVLKNPALIRPGGTRRYITAFFADIAGFTSMAEKMAPEEAAKILHAVINSFTEVIIRHHGVIDKYIGDAIMAFWGAPLDTERDEVNACRSALDCIRALDTINESFRKEGLSEVSVRIGIHSGHAIAGNLGSDRLFDYTVIGDTVNLTSRLEAVNKIFGTKIIITGETLKKTDSIFFTRELALIEVKGKHIPVRIFELICERESTSGETKRTVSAFNRGLALYYEGNFPGALRVFDEALQENPSDGPAFFYRRRCEHHIAAPPADDWKVIRLTEK